MKRRTTMDRVNSAVDIFGALVAPVLMALAVIGCNN